MAPAIASLSALFLILALIVCLTVAESEVFELNKNVTDRMSPWKSGRTKRSSSDRIPRRLRINIRLQTEEEFTLIWIRERQFLANEHLPVIVPFPDSNLNVMNNVGDFVMYYDRTRCSTVVYFEKLNALYGVIGLDYYITGLPFNFHDNGEYQFETIGEPYVMRNVHTLVHINPSVDPPPPSDAEAWNDFFRPFNHNLNGTLQRQASCHLGPGGKHQRTELNIGEVYNDDETNAEDHRLQDFRDFGQHLGWTRFYLEILVFVTRDMIELFKLHFGMDQYAEWIVKYLIIYFNAVEMVFRKIHSIYINIAEIVLEDLTPFDFMSNDELQFREIATKLPQYLQDHQSDFLRDSFDHVFIYTSRPIMNGDMQVNGLTKYGADLYEARKNDRFYDVVPITVVRFQYYYADYAVTVHEIGRVLNMKILPKEQGLQHIGQCHGIMQRDGPKCNNCLKWSDESKEQFEMFLSKNRNRCFLLNEPRSLRVPGTNKFLTPDRQCKCFGFDSYLQTTGLRKKTVSQWGCGMPLQCSKREGAQLYQISTVRPFDGTLCTEKRVCWDGACVPLPKSQCKNKIK